MSRQQAFAGKPTRRTSVGKFDYTAPAEMFMTGAKLMRRPAIAYRRFATAAEAIQFAVEQVSAPFLKGAVLEVLEQRFDHLEIRELYDRDAYPLVRH